MHTGTSTTSTTNDSGCWDYKLNKFTKKREEKIDSANFISYEDSVGDNSDTSNYLHVNYSVCH
jgi:hypothetical protein